MLAIDVEKLATYQMGMEKGIEKGMEKGMKEGAQKGAHTQALAIAEKLLAMGIEPHRIATITELSPAEIEALQAAHLPPTGKH